MDAVKKNALLIAPFFYEYHMSIKRQLEKLSYNVILVNDNITSESKIRYLHSKLPSYNHKYEALQYYRKILGAIKVKIDFLFVIKGDSLTEEVMDYIIYKYPNIITVIYFWDSVNKYPKQKQTAKLFNKVYTYDLKDSQKMGWTYRPLFFDCNENAQKISKTIDVSFIGSLHSRRGELVKKIDKFVRKNDLKSFIYLFCRWTSFINQKYIKKNPDFNIERKLVNFKPISKEQTEEIYQKSSCVVDYQSEDQSGLTIRTIECLAHKCKIITNNTSIMQADFYNPNNIYIYRDISNFSVPVDFIKSAYFETPKNIINKYSIEGFVKDILGGLS